MVKTPPNHRTTADAKNSTTRLRFAPIVAPGSSSLCGALDSASTTMHAVTPVATANAADLVPSVEAYLEANGLSATLKALKSEASAKKMTPSKSVRAPETLPEVAIFFRSHRRRRMRRSPREMRPALTTASRFDLAGHQD